MPRLLHTADWQIGRVYGSLPPDNAAALAEARLTVVERLAALATADAVDMVLVAGDVFDTQTVPDRTLRRLFNALGGFAGPWVLLPGNHDAALAESVWQRAQRLGVVPDHVHLALTPQPLVFADQGVVVLPAPLTQRHSFADLTAWFDAAPTPPGLLRVGLAHGSVQGILAPDIDSPNPLAPDRAETAALAYLALGDWHSTKAINARTWYAGTPEQDRFRGGSQPGADVVLGQGPGHALRVTLPADGGLPQVTPVATGQFRWRPWQLSLQVSADVQALLDGLSTLTATDVLDLRLEGVVDWAAHQQLQNALAQAEGRLRHLQVDDSALQLAPTDEDLAQLQADGYLGEVLAELRQLQAQGGPTARTATDALALLATALAPTA